MSKTAFPDLIEALSSFNTSGFTRLQAAAYIAMLQLGPETGSAIAKASGINRSKIYDILEQLEQLGAIKKLPIESKIKYEAIPPGTVLPKILDEFKTEIKKSQTLLESISNLQEDIDVNLITLTTLFTKDLNTNDYLYLISSTERARTNFIEQLPQPNRPAHDIKILNLNDSLVDRGLIMLVNNTEMLIFNVPIGQSVEALKISNSNFSRFFLGIIESGWIKDLDHEVTASIESGNINALYIGKALTMRYLINDKEEQKYERPVSFIVTGDYISFFYEGIVEEPRIPIRFVSKVQIIEGHDLVLYFSLNRGPAELWIKTVENPLYLKNLVLTLTKLLNN